MKHSENHPATDKSAEVTNQIVAILEKENFGMGGKKLKIENIINKNTKEKIHFSEEQQIKIQIALLKSDGVNAKDESSKSYLKNEKDLIIIENDYEKDIYYDEAKNSKISVSSYVYNINYYFNIEIIKIYAFYT